MGWGGGWAGINHCSQVLRLLMETVTMRVTEDAHQDVNVCPLAGAAKKTESPILLDLILLCHVA